MGNRAYIYPELPSRPDATGYILSRYSMYPSIDSANGTSEILEASTLSYIRVIDDYPWQYVSLQQKALILIADVFFLARTLTTQLPLRLRCATQHRCSRCQPQLTSQVQDSLLADPNGWTRKPPGLNSTARVLASTVGAPTSSIKNILEEKALDQYVFSYKKSSGPEVFYLFSSGSADTYQVESPRTQKELWDALKYNDWRKRLTLKEL